jgi:hypothetical protein
MRKIETFEREKVATGPAPRWLARIWEINDEATGNSKPLPFGGTPVLGNGTETYPSGATVVFTGSTGCGTVTLSWDE